MSSERNFNEIAESIIYNFLIDPNADEKIKKLKEMPKTCNICNVKGLVPTGEPIIRSFKNYLGVMDEETIQCYVCPNCGTKFKWYHNSLGAGMVEI